MYFNRNKLFLSIFDIASYVAKMSYPCELDLSNIPLSELNFNTRIYNLLKDKNTIEDLQRVINKGVLLDIYGIGVTIAKNIVYTLGEFYFKNCELL